MIEIVASIDSYWQRKRQQNGYERNGGISINYTEK